MSTEIPQEAPGAPALPAPAAGSSAPVAGASPAAAAAATAPDAAGAADAAGASARTAVPLLRDAAELLASVPPVSTTLSRAVAPLPAPGAVMPSPRHGRNPWALPPICDISCSGRSTGSVPPHRRAQRYASVAYTLSSAVRAGERLNDPAMVRDKARSVLAGLGVRVEGAPESLSARPSDGATGCGTGANTGTGTGTGTLIVANHISWLDIVTMLSIEPVTLLAKREIGDWPVIGELARRMGTRFVHRSNVRELPLMVREMADMLREGRSVMVFPQATTWCSVADGGFYRAPFQAAIDAGAPVRPVTLDYRQGPVPTRLAGFLGTENFTASLRRVSAARDLTARVTSHDLIGSSGTDRRTLAEAARVVVTGDRRPLHLGEIPRPNASAGS